MIYLFLLHGLDVSVFFVCPKKKKCSTQIAADRKLKMKKIQLFVLDNIQLEWNIVDNFTELMC